MKIYVGRWELLPSCWEGIARLAGADEKTIIEELAREVEEYDNTHPIQDKRMGVYTPKEFESEFNWDTKGQFNTETYWIKIF